MKHNVVFIRNSGPYNKGGQCEIYVDGRHVDPAKSQAIWNHSPDGFNFGYGGSGPAQSALGILLAVMPKEDAMRHHQEFKWRYIGRPEFLNAPRGEFEFDADDILFPKEAQA